MGVYKQAQELILSKDWDALREMLDNTYDHNRCESIVAKLLEEKFTSGWGEDKKVLGTNEAPQELIDYALETFCRCDSKWDHGGWTHSLSHFTDKIWKRGLMGWVKRLNEQAFGNAENGYYGYNGQDPFSCCDRLVGDICEYGAYDLNPSDLAITPERLARFNNSDLYIEVAQKLPFDSDRSKRVFIAKKVLEDCSSYDIQVCDGKVDFGRVDRFLTELEELNEPTDDYVSLKLRLIDENITDMERRIEKLGDETPDWINEHLAVLRIAKANL